MKINLKWATNYFPLSVFLFLQFLLCFFCVVAYGKIFRFKSERKVKILDVCLKIYDETFCPFLRKMRNFGMNMRERKSLFSKSSENNADLLKTFTLWGNFRVKLWGNRLKFAATCFFMHF